MDKTYWFLIIPPLVTIIVATWSKKIIPSLLIGLITRSYFFHSAILGGFETTLEQIENFLVFGAKVNNLKSMPAYAGHANRFMENHEIE